MQICQSLSIKDHRKLTFHRQFIMNNFTLGTIFFGIVLIMGQLPGNSGQMLPYRHPYIYPRPHFLGKIVARSQPESGSEEHKKNEKHGKYDDREFIDFCIAINKFCKLSGSGEDFKWQGLHLCTKVCAIPGLMPKYYSNKKHGLFLGQPGTDCHFYVNFSKNV